METSGTFRTEDLDLFAEITRQVRAVTQEVRARAFLLQQVSVALQRGNAASTSVGVNGLCLTFSGRPCNRISLSFKIGTNYMYIIE